MDREMVQCIAIMAVHWMGVGYRHLLFILHSLTRLVPIVLHEKVLRCDVLQYGKKNRIAISLVPELEAIVISTNTK